jgi:GNAT superfamily N-acetyltransferase
VDGVDGSVVSSFEPWLALCLDAQKGVKVHSFLYHGLLRPENPLHGFDHATFAVVSEAELKAVETFVRSCFEEDPGDWLSGYLENLVGRGELFTLCDSGAFLGTGELRVSDTQPPYADLGVIVSPAHRCRGLASYILSRLRERCHQGGLLPICSTTVANKSAQRAISKAGFVDRHRLLEILF